VDSSEELRFFAVLVHRGLLGKDDAERLFARSRETGRSLIESAVEQGLFTRERLERLHQLEGEDAPALPGYEYLGIAGRGGTALVIHAREQKTGKDVAVKVLRHDLTEDKVARSRFLNEAKLLLELRHENIVEGYRVGRFQDRLVFLMEFVPGKSLQELLQQGATFGEDAALYVILQVARALTYLSVKGVVHRDVKPGNVLLTQDNRVKLIDLGFAASAGAGTERSESTVGTVAYISPEQARGEGDLDVRADIYSLGATLYQLVVGELPFSGDSNQEVLAAQILESLSTEAMHRRRVSPHMRYFLEKMMAKEREVRYQTPTDLIRDIEEQIRGKKSLQYDSAPRDPKDLLDKPFLPERPPARRADLKRRRRR